MYSLLIYDPHEMLTRAIDSPLRVSIARSNRDLCDLLCKKEWDTIITFNKEDWDYLSKQSYNIRRKWVNLDGVPTDQELVSIVQEVYYAYTQSEGDFPLISIYTPTYNSRDFIMSTASSVQLQIYDNWEWVIVDDGSTDDTVDLLRSLKDPRIRIFEFPNSGRIGYNKRAASSLCKGKYLVELDHDDFLTANALVKIKDAFDSDSEVGMVYSNCAEWWQNSDKSNTYSAPYWNYRDTKWNGITLKEGLCHDAMGKCLLDGGEDWVINNMPICPNHVRAFRASVLSSVGGYLNLVWADDYDLMIRMFIHSKIKHIDEMIYVQRFGTNTWTKNSSILWPCFEKVREKYKDALDLRFKELS